MKDRSMRIGRLRLYIGSTASPRHLWRWDTGMSLGVTLRPGSGERCVGAQWRYATPENVECRTCGGTGCRQVDQYGNVWGDKLAEAMSPIIVGDIPCPDCTPENVEETT